MPTVPVVAVARHTHNGFVRRPGERYARALESIDPAEVHAPDPALVDWWSDHGRILQAEGGRAVPRSLFPVPGSLRIAQGVGYDPGCAAYRHHTAVNECTQHASTFVRWSDTNPHCSLRQYDGDRDRDVVRQLVLDADVLHCHVNYMLPVNSIGRVRARPEQLVIRHYHGSIEGGTCMEHAIDDDVFATGNTLRVGARLSHLAEEGAEDLEWLPIPVPVERYRRMRIDMRPLTGRLKIAHSPTKRELKGTEIFLRVCERLQARHVPVEPVLIENVSHAEALSDKSVCDAVFDSFWLGIQGSGLEGAAMGLPVIAGDPDVAALYRRHVGYVPYVFAPDEQELERAIEQLATERSYYDWAAWKASRYVAQHHDYPRVAERYERILARALGRTDVITARVAA